MNGTLVPWPPVEHFYTGLRGQTPRAMNLGDAWPVRGESGGVFSCSGCGYVGTRNPEGVCPVCAIPEVDAEADELLWSALWERAFGSPNQPRRVEKQPGRNDPCPCGSGRKFKRCCGG